MAAPTSTTIARVPALVFFRLARSLSSRSFIRLDAHAHDLAIGVDQLVADLHRELEGELGVLALHRDLVEVVDLAGQEVDRQRLGRAHRAVDVRDTVVERVLEVDPRRALRRAWSLLRRQALRDEALRGAHGLARDRRLLADAIDHGSAVEGQRRRSSARSAMRTKFSCAVRLAS